MRNIAAIALLVLVLAPVRAHAGIDDAGTAVASFLTLGTGPDALAMGGAAIGRSGTLDLATWNPGALSRQRRPQKRTNDERYPDRQRDQPVHEVRQVLPERQLLSVVYIEGDEHEYVGQAHPCDMNPDPVPPASPEGRAPDPGACERHRSENEQVIALAPPHQR